MRVTGIVLCAKELERQLSAVSSQLCSPAWRVRVGYEVIVRQRLVIICKWKLRDLKGMGAGHLAAWEGWGGGWGGAGIDSGGIGVFGYGINILERRLGRVEPHSKTRHKRP